MICLNKDIKKENLRKDLINLIETNHQIKMTSDHSISNNNSFKNHLNTKSFHMILTYCATIFGKHKIRSNRTKSLLIVNSFNINSKNNEGFAMEQRSDI